MFIHFQNKDIIDSSKITPSKKDDMINKDNNPDSISIASLY